MRLPIWQARVSLQRDHSRTGIAGNGSERTILLTQDAAPPSTQPDRPEMLSRDSHGFDTTSATSSAVSSIATAPNTVASSSRPHRKAHNKVKTGCLTCKIRKKKCDEAKPFCRRCVDTGRKCDGYVKQNAVIMEERTVLFGDVRDTGREGGVPGHGSVQKEWKWQDCPEHPHWLTVGNVSWLTQTSPSSLLPLVCKGVTGRDCACTPQTSLHHTVQCLSRCPLYARLPSSLQFGSSVEYSCFDFFRSKTGPGFGGWFDSGVWSGRMISACFISEIVLQAVAAVGAVHRRWELGLTPEAFKWCEISDRLYRNMLRAWKRKVRLGEEGSKEVVEEWMEVKMVLGKLCATFEAFQDEMGKARQWMVKAFEGLVGSDVRLIEREERMVDVVVSDAALVQYAMKLEREMEWLCGAALCDVEGSIQGKVDDVAIGDRFESIEEARDRLFAEVRAIWRIDYTVLSAENMRREQQRHLERLMQWSVAYAGYAQVYRPNNDPLLKRVGRLLKWYREAAFLHLLLHTTEDAQIDEFGMVNCHHQAFLARSLGDPYCSRHISVQAQFARLCLLSDGLGDVPLGHGLMIGVRNAEWKMHVGTSSCRSLAVRKRVRELLGGWAGKGLGAYSIAETVSELEERVVLEAVEGGVSGEARGTSAKWVDISYFAGEKMVCLIYCRDDGMARRELVWVREWYKLR